MFGSNEKKVRTDQGLSLVEVVVALGVSTVAILGGAELMNFNGRVQKNFSNEIAFNQLVGLVGQVLSDSRTCSDSLSGQPETGNVVLYKPGTTHTAKIAAVGDDLQGLRISELKLLNPLVLPGGDKMATLRLTASKGPKSIGVKTLSREFLVRVTSQSGKIKQCWSNSLVETACSKLGGTYDADRDPPCLLQNVVTGPSCKPGEAVTGFKPDGTLACATMPKVVVTATPKPTPAPTPTPTPTSAAGAGNEAACATASGTLWNLNCRGFIDKNGVAKLYMSVSSVNGKCGGGVVVPYAVEDTGFRSSGAVNNARAYRSGSTLFCQAGTCAGFKTCSASFR